MYSPALALPLFLFLCVCPTALTTDAAAVAALQQLPLPLLPPRVRTLHEMTKGGDGGRWRGDAGMGVVAVAPCIRKCERWEGLGAEISKLSYYGLVLGAPSGTTGGGD
jgi:hypothetical protein